VLKSHARSVLAARVGLAARPAEAEQAPCIDLAGPDTRYAQTVLHSAHYLLRDEMTPTDTASYRTPDAMHEEIPFFAFL
jgi:hypothetical protein